ncbi:MAG: HAMP domain-containing histidine kinase [Archangiaceae bacterium]|nr:HAMP domain-containing histidine kinase [Archangiaceae bacterium]
MQQQLFHAERLATLGTFAAGISHELKNIVAVFSSMLGTLDRLPNGYLLDDEAFTALKQTTQHASELAQSVLQVSRASGPSDDRVELAGVVRDVTAMLRAAGRTRHLDVRLTLPSQPVTAHASMLEVQQVLMNLIGNATDAIGNKRDARIEITLSQESELAHLAVSDNGPGIPDHVKAKLFTPFFTTKPPGKGTGLGLSVIKQIVEKWHGSVELESTVGQGTSVHVKLPLSKVNADD